MAHAPSASATALSPLATTGACSGHRARRSCCDIKPGGALVDAGVSLYVGPITAASVMLKDLPAAQKYTVQTTWQQRCRRDSGAARATPGRLIWSDAFPFGSSIYGVTNAIVGTPTVHTGGSGFVGSSGTMTYAGIELRGGYNTQPVLNVTASGGAITGVTSVADPGDCLRANIPATSTQWTPGGGLSGGSGASFNMTFNQWVTVQGVILVSSPEPASVTHTSGSPGQMWTIPVGVHRRVQGSMHNDTVT